MPTRSSSVLWVVEFVPDTEWRSGTTLVQYEYAPEPVPAGPDPLYAQFAEVVYEPAAKERLSAMFVEVVLYSGGAPPVTKKAKVPIQGTAPELLPGVQGFNVQGSRMSRRGRA